MPSQNLHGALSPLVRRYLDMQSAPLRTAAAEGHAVSQTVPSGS